MLKKNFKKTKTKGTALQIFNGFSQTKTFYVSILYMGLCKNDNLGSLPKALKLAAVSFLNQDLKARKASSPCLHLIIQIKYLTYKVR